MIITLGQRQVELTKDTVIAAGGEAVIHRDPDHPRSRAIKIYHPLESTGDAAQDANNRAGFARRENKIRAFLDSKVKLDKRMMAPLEIAEAARGKFAGFGMLQLDRRIRKFAELFSPSFCATNNITTQTVADICLQIGKDLDGIIHKVGVVGDLNDGAIMIHEENHGVYWVDVDSWDIPGFPCIVGTELYLCPDLYGKDLQAGRAFKHSHDWWSYSVLLFRALLRKHPFKAGTHRKYRSVLERAQNGITLLDPSVTYPPAGLKPEILTDELTHALLEQLHGRSQNPFPLKALAEYRNALVACKGCGVWYPHTRKNCPQCSEKTAVHLPKLLSILMQEIVAVKGRILAVFPDVNSLTCLSEEGGNIVLYRYREGKPLQRSEVGIPLGPQMRFGVFDGLLVICDDPDANEVTAPLYVLDVGVGSVEAFSQTSTVVFSGQGPVFSTSRRFLYRQAGNTLLCGERFGTAIAERPVSQVFNGQSWFIADPNPPDSHEVVVGFNRDLGQFSWFISRGGPDGRTFTTVNLSIQPLRDRESMFDHSVIFGETELLVVRKTRRSGREYVFVSRIEISTAKVVSDEILEIRNNPLWEAPGGRAFRGSFVMHPTDTDGIVRENLTSHQSTPLPDTARLVSADDSVVAFGDELLLVRSDRVLLLKKK